MIPGGEGSSAARRIGIGRAQALPRALELARALRPFKTPWSAGRRQRLDVDATIRGYAESGELIPAFRPSPEQWFEAALVVDGSPGMTVWDDVVTEFRRLLRQTGAFRTIRLLRLDVVGDETVLRNVAGARIAPRQLRTPDARRIVFVLSDCAAYAWQQPPIWQTLHAWSASTPTVLVNPLSAKLWHHAGLDLPAARVRAMAPGSRNSALTFRPPPLARILDNGGVPWLPLPVVGLTPPSLGRYAATLMRGSAAGCEAVLLSPSGRPGGAARRRSPVAGEKPAADVLVTAFRRLASPEANRIAILASTCERLTLPMLRLIAEQGVPEAESSDVGETIAGGLFDVDIEQDIAVLTFRPGVRERLQEGLRIDDVWYVYDLLSRHAEEQVSGTDRFPVLVPAEGGDRAVPTGQVPFAVISVDALEVLGIATETAPDEIAPPAEPGPGSTPISARYLGESSWWDRPGVRSSAEVLRETRLQLSTLDVPPGRGWFPLGERLAEILNRRPGTIAEVISELAEVQTVLDELPPAPSANRVASFNELLLTITRRVESALAARAHEADYLELLEIEFARRYFAALNLWNLDDENTPESWEVLFKRAGDVQLSRLVAAMVGVNAHLNHDLPLALIATWSELGAPDEDLIHPDYLLINEIFYEEIPALRRGYSTRWQIEIDTAVGEIDDWSQRMLVGAARGRAWDQARRLWPLRHDAEDFEQARRAVDRAVALLGEWVIIGARLDTGTAEGKASRLFGRRA
jgi:hypothetical protein